MSGVFLLPGWGGNYPHLVPFARALDSEARPVRVLAYPWWDPRMALDDAIEDLESDIPAYSSLVGHSLGGVLAVLLSHRKPMSSVVAIGSPLGGIRGSSLTVGMLRQLHGGDELFAQTSGPVSCPTLVVASTQDRIVPPSQVTAPPGATLLRGPYGGHLRMLGHPDVRDAVCDALRRNDSA